jgi:hypothetical protein
MERPISDQSEPQKDIRRVRFSKICFNFFDNLRFCSIFEVCGVPIDKLRTISSAVDKLDKVCDKMFST